MLKRSFPKIKEANKKWQQLYYSALVYDSVGQTNMESKEADLELQQNPAYGISQTDSNIVYESCK